MPVQSRPDARSGRQSRLIAFYLPQFHPIPENDAWWGEGFTEWTNVRKAGRFYEGHEQPRAPGELGYYDLRRPEARAAQAALARAAGIEAFCYWHYWFGDGRRLLEQPMDEVIRTGEPDFPFCLCWANQSWTGVWHGAPNRVLMEQRYPGKEDERRHFQAVLPMLTDRRYLTVDGRPMFLVYKPEELPDAAGFMQHWRMLGRSVGIPDFFFGGMSNKVGSPELRHFDAVIPIGPGDFLDGEPKPNLAIRAVKKALRGRLAPHIPEQLLLRLGFPARYDYGTAAAKAFERMPKGDEYFPCVLAGWDNTPRSGHRGVVLEGFTPDTFRSALRRAIGFVEKRDPEHRIVFLKAWNEWAEGNYLEPDARWGSAFLDVVAAENRVAEAVALSAVGSG